MSPRALPTTALIALLSLPACSAVYPRYSTAYRPAPPGLAEGGELSPPPDAVQRIAVIRGEVPRTTRDGRAWDDDAGPDPYVVVLRNGDEVFRSRVLQNTLRPEWDPQRDYADIWVRDGDTLRVEFRDDDGLSYDPIGVGEVRGIPSDARNGGVWLMRLEGRPVVELRATPPPPQLGMGVTYEYRGDALLVTEVQQAGPAYAAGLRVGDRITAIQGRPVSAMGELEVRQAMDRGSMGDVSLVVARDRGAPTEMTVRRDAVYPAR
jgi:hypothetical protein